METPRCNKIINDDLGERYGIEGVCEGGVYEEFNLEETDWEYISNFDVWSTHASSPCYLNALERKSSGPSEDRRGLAGGTAVLVDGVRHASQSSIFPLDNRQGQAGFVIAHYNEHCPRPLTRRYPKVRGRDTNHWAREKDVVLKNTGVKARLRTINE